MKHKPKLGQNFLVDDAARHAIVDALGDLSKRTVIEIGPGHGAITEIVPAVATDSSPWSWTEHWPRSGLPISRSASGTNHRG